MRVITIGRDSENDVVIDDAHASRHHLQIILHDDGHFTLSDFGSTNGTFVNGQRISGEIQIEPNDIVRIGNTTIPWRQYFEEPESIASRPQNANINSVATQPVDAVNKERHGFVTFWLWLGIITNIITIPINLMNYQSYSNLGQMGMYLKVAGVDTTPFSEAVHLHILILQAAVFIGGICLIVSYIKLLNWKKIGFWIFVSVSVVLAIVTAVVMHFIEQDYMLIGLTADYMDVVIAQAIAAPMSILILWAILQIRKNGISCWKQLE